MTDLKKKAIKIKGKDYVLVKDRVIAFNEEYEDGCIQTELLSDPSAETIVFKAMVIPDIKTPEKRFIGHAQETVGDGHINQSAALENAETSAVGRALAMMGIGVIDSIASVDEINKATRKPKKDYDFEYNGYGYKKFKSPKTGKILFAKINIETGEQGWSNQDEYMDAADDATAGKTPDQPDF